MKAINTVFVLLFMCFTVSCSTIYGVQYDYDKHFDFKSLKTYDWMTVPEKANIDSLIVERVKKAVNAGLKDKGLIMTSDNPDFLIAEHLGEKDKVDVTERYRRGITGPRGVSAYQIEEGSLILDFVDAKSKKMIWRGAAKAGVDNLNTPEQSEKLINEAVQEILEKFPPKSK
jgi:hypothetical protein